MKIPQYLYSSIEDLQRFVALLVQQMQADLSDNGWQVPQLSQTNIDRIVSGGFTFPAFLPVMRPGTLWFNTDIKKLQFITNQAIPSTLTDATYETVTSV